jgi:uncharacterized protein (TIRG00374 family)
VQLLLGLSVSAAALWLTLRGKDLSAIWDAVRGGDYRYVAGYLALSSTAHFVRVVRWRILLRGIAEVPFATVNAACAVGFLATLLLPLRLGELVRPVLVSDGVRVRVPAALSTVIVERVAEGLVTALLLVVTLLFVQTSAPGVALLRAGGIVALAVFLCAVVLLAALQRNRDALKSVASRRGDGREAMSTLVERLSSMASAFVSGLRSVPSRSGVAAFLALSVALLGLGAWSLDVLAAGFGLELTAHQAFTVLGVLVVGTMIPAGPAMVGTFQASAVVGLALFFPREIVVTRGIAFANVLWAAQLVQTMAFGIPFLASRRISLRGALARRVDEDEDLVSAAQLGTPRGRQ